MALAVELWRTSWEDERAEKRASTYCHVYAEGQAPDTSRSRQVVSSGLFTSPHSAVVPAFSPPPSPPFPPKTQLRNGRRLELLRVMLSVLICPRLYASC